VPILILVIGAMALFIDFMPGPTGLGSGAKFISLSNPEGGFGQTPQTKLGLDLQGGFEIKYGVKATDKGSPNSDQMANIRSIMEQRVNSTGAVEPIVETVGSNEILIQVPGAANQKEIEDLVGVSGTLTFVWLPPADYGTDSTTGTKAVPGKGTPIDPSLTAQFTGADLDVSKIQAVNNTASIGNWKILFGFAGSKGKDFETWTSQHLHEFFAIVLDGVVHPINDHGRQR